MNGIIEALKAALGVLAGLLPDRWASLVNMVRALLGMLDLEPGDPKAERVAAEVARLMTDMQAVMHLDEAAQVKARLILENRFTRFMDGISPGGGL